MLFNILCFQSAYLSYQNFLEAADAPLVDLDPDKSQVSQAHTLRLCCHTVVTEKAWFCPAETSADSDIALIAAHVAVILLLFVVIFSFCLFIDRCLRQMDAHPEPGSSGGFSIFPPVA